MEHHFNIKFAKLYGIEEAIIVHNLYFWIIKNIANNVHEHDGRYWTYNSNNAFVALFPYMNKTKICRVMAHLESENIIIKDNFNQDSRDRTLWYAFTDYGINILNDCKYDVSKMTKCTVQNELCKIQNETTIPYNKQTDSKQKENKDNKLSLSKKGEELPNWKTDFNAYLELVYDAKEKLLANMSVKAKKLEYYPNINYELTIEKMVDDFWGTEEGWKNKIKVSKKSKTIDMVKTLVKGFDYTQNRVYKSIKSGGYGNNYTNTYQQPNNGSNRLIDGENKDGTYNRNGYRYYYSMRDDREYSIPINAEPMPSIDYEFDMTTKKWIPPTTNNNVNGNLW